MKFAIKIKHAKRVISACTLASMMLCNVAPAMAHDMRGSDFENGIVNLDTFKMGEYIDLAMSNYIIAAGLDARLSYSITNPIPMFVKGEKSPLGYTVFLICDDGTVGEMNVYWRSGSYISDFSIIPNFDMRRITQSDICIIVDEEGKWLCSSNKGTISLVDNDSTYIVPTDCEYSVEVTLNEFTINSNCLVSSMSDTGATLGRVSLNVPYVSNYYGADANNSGGICWAATVAMKINYLKNKRLTAKMVYDLAKEELNSTQGSISTITGLYNLYDIDVTAKTTSSGFITNQQAWDCLNANTPIDLAIIGYENSNYTGAEHYHQVLLTGMTIGSAGLSYEFYCPNSSTKKYVFISGTPNITTTKKMGDFMYTDSWSKSRQDVILYWKNIYRLYY